MTFEEKVRELVKKTKRNNEWRQRETVNLIPSETTVSPLVQMLEISDPAGRYAEHTTVKGREVYYYQGTDFIAEVEERLREEMRKFFRASDVELRPISGSMANRVVFEALLKYADRELRSVMNNSLVKGGHLTAQPMGALFRCVDKVGGIEPRIINFPGRDDNPYRTDVAKLGDLLRLHQPELIILGRSMFLFPEPVREVADLVRDMNPRPIIMYDMAHVLGLYGAFQSPLEEGADIVTGSTHKTFFGPQRGVIAANVGDVQVPHKLWAAIRSRGFPGNTSNHHLGTLLALLMATYEMNEFRLPYQTQVRANAKAFAVALTEHGIQVEGASDGYTETHQVVINVRNYGNGQEMARRLEQNNIITNFQALPYDSSFNDSSGIRMGVQEMTRFGMREEDFRTLAGFVAGALSGKDVKDGVTRFRQGFLRMQYCLEPQIAAPLAAELLLSMMPHNEYARLFAENLDRMVSGK